MQLDEITASTWEAGRYGAAGDGTTDDAAAIQLAIDRCHQAGGGQVLLAAGTYRCTAITLRSHVQLHFAAGATLSAPADAREPLIVARAAEHVSITGIGTIDGSVAGAALVVLEDCRRVRVHDLTMVHAHQGSLRLDGCRDVDVRGLTVTNSGRHRDGTGLDIVDSSDVSISDCRVSAGATALAVRTSERRGDADQSCTGVIVGRCTLGAERGIDIAGAGGLIRNGLFSDLVITDSGTGIHVGARSAESRIESLRFANLIIDARVPFTVRAESGAAISGLTFSGMSITAPAGATLTGTAAAPLERLRFSEIDWTVSVARDAAPTAAIVGSDLADLIVDGVTVHRDQSLGGGTDDDFVLERARRVLVRPVGE